MANPNFCTQLVISTHSSHIARETNFADLRYFKRLVEGYECDVATSKVINLSEVFGNQNETEKFVTRYLQTTHCDLFFADAAILVEGAAEGMLLPHFIRNNYHELYQRYISILQINGRHAYRLRSLIDTLCLPTLVITDLDTGEKEGNHKAARPERGKELISTNPTINKWFDKELDFDKLIALPYESKEIKKDTPYPNSIRMAYQTPINIEFREKTEEALSSTFEDCLIYSNFTLFSCLEDNEELGRLLKTVNNSINKDLTFEDLHAVIYKELKNGQSNKKAEFALDMIYAIDPEEITVPSYIAEGLEWLQTLLHS